MMVVRHLITLFLHFIFYDVFRFFSCICPNNERYGIADVGLVRPIGLAPEAWRDARGIEALALAPPKDDDMETVA